MNQWYRVIDPQSPLFGCEVRGWISEAAIGADNALVVEAMRRLDMIVGDRPFQMIAAAGDNLGLAIRADQLEVSAVQEDIVEMSRESPYGKFVDEWRYDNDRSGYELQLVRYEGALQAVLRSEDGIVAKNTWISSESQDLSDLESHLTNMLGSADPANLEIFIQTGGR
jgi:hypothetical protein